MTREEFIKFLQDMYNYEKVEEREKFAEDFFSKMLAKYNNQFDTNGYIEELIELLNKFKDKKK